MLRNFLKVSVFSTAVNVALLILRAGTAALMIPHGWAKLQRFIAGEWQFADPIGIGSFPSLVSTIFTELICSALVIAGLFTRPAATALAFTAFIIVFKVHWKDGLDKMEHGLLFLLPFIFIAIAGPGKYALDYSIFGKKKR
jgi:putative oxidoreductase